MFQLVPGTLSGPVRYADLATQLGVEWTAVYVETPTLQRLAAPERERILRTVKLAQELGAKTAILSGEDRVALVVEYARTHNCSKIVTGRSEAKRVWPWACWRRGRAVSVWSTCTKPSNWIRNSSRRMCCW